MNDQIFENKYKITIPLIKKWTKNPTNKHRRNLFIIIMTMSFISGVMGIIRTFVTGDYVLLIFSFLFVLYPLLFVILLNSKIKRQYKYFMSLQVEKDKWDRKIKFTDKIECTDNNSSTVYEYSQIKKLDENKDFFDLWLTENNVIRVYKDKFTIGTENDFREFINKKVSGSLEKKKIDKKIIFMYILMVCLFFWNLQAVLEIIGVSSKYNSLENIKQSFLERKVDSTKDIDTVELKNMVVYFTTDDIDRLNVCIIDKNNKGYKIYDIFSYSIDEVARYNERVNYLFEDSETLRTVKGSKEGVVFGCTYSNYNFTDKDKEKFKFQEFTCNGIEYTLYYYLEE